MSPAPAGIPAHQLAPGDLISVGRYTCQVLTHPTPAPRRSRAGLAEVSVQVRDLTDGAVENITLSAAQAYPLHPGACVTALR